MAAERDLQDGEGQPVGAEGQRQRGGDRDRQPGDRQPPVMLHPRHRAPGRGGADHRSNHKGDQRETRLAGRDAADGLEIERDIDGEADERPHAEAGGEGAGAHDGVRQHRERDQRLRRVQQPVRESG